MQYFIDMVEQKNVPVLCIRSLNYPKGKEQ